MPVGAGHGAARRLYGSSFGALLGGALLVAALVSFFAASLDSEATAGVWWLLTLSAAFGVFLLISGGLVSLWSRVRPGDLDDDALLFDNGQRMAPRVFEVWMVARAVEQGTMGLFLIVMAAMVAGLGGVGPWLAVPLALLGTLGLWSTWVFRRARQLALAAHRAPPQEVERLAERLGRTRGVSARVRDGAWLVCGIARLEQGKGPGAVNALHNVGGTGGVAAHLFKCWVAVGREDGIPGARKVLGGAPTRTVGDRYRREVLAALIALHEGQPQTVHVASQLAEASLPPRWQGWVDGLAVAALWEAGRHADARRELAASPVEDPARFDTWPRVAAALRAAALAP